MITFHKQQSLIINFLHKNYLSTTTSIHHDRNFIIQPAPAPPKLPANSYALFVQKMAMQLPNRTLMRSHISNIAKQWNSLSPTEKSIYNAQAKQRFDQYNLDMAQYHQKYTKLQIDLYQQSIRIKEGDKINKKFERERLKERKKKPPTAYHIFLMDYCVKSKTPGKTMVEYVKEASSLWRSMDVKAKVPYLERALQKYQDMLV